MGAYFPYPGKGSGAQKVSLRLPVASLWVAACGPPSSQARGRVATSGSPRGLHPQLKATGGCVSAHGASGCSALSRGILGGSGVLGAKVEATGRASSSQSCRKRGAEASLGSCRFETSFRFLYVSQVASHAPSCHRRSHLGRNWGPENEQDALRQIREKRTPGPACECCERTSPRPGPVTGHPPKGPRGWHSAGCVEEPGKLVSQPEEDTPEWWCPQETPRWAGPPGTQEAESGRRPVARGRFLSVGSPPGDGRALGPCHRTPSPSGHRFHKDLHSIRPFAPCTDACALSELWSASRARAAGDDKGSRPHSRGPAPQSRSSQPPSR